MNITIDDHSPTITYGPPNTHRWITDHSIDTETAKYYGSTFHSTYNDGDYMSYSFSGALAVYVIGALRDNHGLYSTQLDGGNTAFIMGYSSESAFQQPLFHAKGLEPERWHTIVIKNLPSQTNPPGSDTLRWYLDIDCVILTLPSEVKPVVYDDFSPSFTYQGFTALPNFGSGYVNGTNHLTFDPTAVANFAFNGSAVAINGGINADHGNYSVILDGGQNHIFNGWYHTLVSNVSLFFAANLTEGPHVLTMRNIGSAGAKAFDIDSAIVYSSSPPADNDAVNATSSDTTSESYGANVGAIAGGVIGGVVAIVLLGLLWFFAFRSRHPKLLHEAVDLTSESVTHDHHSNGTEIIPFPRPVQGFGTREDRPILNLLALLPPSSSYRGLYPRPSAGEIISNGEQAPSAINQTFYPPAVLEGTAMSDKSHRPNGRPATIRPLLQGQSGNKEGDDGLSDALCQPMELPSYQEVIDVSHGVR